MWICDNCGELYEELEKHCKCGGYIVNAIECKACGEYYDEDILIGFGKDKICESCYDNSLDFENAFEYGTEDKEKREINGFLATHFSDDQIENILIEVLKKSRFSEYELAKEYLGKDNWDFGEMIAKNIK